jgi:hypothetical protein
MGSGSSVSNDKKQTVDTEEAKPVATKVSNNSKEHPNSTLSFKEAITDPNARSYFIKFIKSEREHWSSVIEVNIFS